MEGEYVNFYENPVKRVMQFTGRNTHAVVIIFVMRSRILNQNGFVLSLREIIREAPHQLSCLFQFVNFQHKPTCRDLYY